jgi:hypothetical protein
MTLVVLQARSRVSRLLSDSFGGAESRASYMSEPCGARIHLFVIPSPVELEQARERLTRASCPRRYCCYGHTLAFNGDLSPAEGCQVAERHSTSLRRGRAQGEPVPAWQACCRATGNPQHADSYEPREPHLEADGWPADFLQMVGTAAQRRRLERRQRGKLRREQDGGGRVWYQGDQGANTKN